MRQSRGGGDFGRFGQHSRQPGILGSRASKTFHVGAVQFLGGPVDRYVNGHILAGASGFGGVALSRVKISWATGILPVRGTAIRVCLLLGFTGNEPLKQLNCTAIQALS